MRKLWIARDKRNNQLSIFKTRPIKDTAKNVFISSVAKHADGLGIGMTDCIGVIYDENEFPDVTWDNSPKMIEIGVIDDKHNILPSIQQRLHQIKTLHPEFSKIIGENFWDLLA